MYQVIYNYLKMREPYDEIVAIIENDQTTIKYPNRVALHIISSPYMKQLDYETVTDAQNQQNKLAKQKVKDMELQETPGRRAHRACSSEPSATRAEWLPPCNNRDQSAIIWRLCGIA